MGGRLIYRDSQGREGSVELSATDTVYVGRGLECAIRTDDGMVSRRHSQIRMEGGRYVVEDLGSSNGTLLNNIRVQKQALGHADVIQCGSLMIRFVDEGSPNVLPQSIPSAGAPPPKKGGTMVLEQASIPPIGGANPLAGSSSNLASSGGSGGGMSSSGGAAYGGPPAMPGTPYGGGSSSGPPAMPGGGGFGGAAGGSGGGAAGARAGYGGAAGGGSSGGGDRKSTRLNSSHNPASRMPSSA
jgi:hypothetical protein